MACRVEQVGNVDLHRAQILHAVHVTVGVGLAVVPDPRRRLDEVWTAVDRHQAGEVGELGHPRGRVAEAERGRQGGDAAPRGVRVVAGEDVHEPGLRDDGAVAGADHVAALAEEAANAAGGVERLREERLAAHPERLPRIDRHVGGGELDVHERGEDALRVAPVGRAELPVPRAEVRARRVVRDRGQLALLLAEPGTDHEVGRVARCAGHGTAKLPAAASRDNARQGCPRLCLRHSATLARTAHHGITAKRREPRGR